MIKRILLILIGALLLAIVIYLGWLASTTSSLVIWFGVASAILAPAGFALIGFALKSGENELLIKLSKVPEIQQLIEKAQTQEEKIKALEGERAHLEEVVKFEALRSTLLERKTSLERDGVLLLESLDSIEIQLEKIEVEVEASPDKDIIQKLRERIRLRQRGDIIMEFGSASIVVNTNRLQSLPGGHIIIVYIKAISEVVNLLDRFNKKLLTRRSS